MNETILGEAVKYAGTIALALLFLAYVAQRFFNSWKSGSTESSVVTLLHDELERMSSHNTNLMEELQKLQKQVIALNTQLFTLTKENQVLHSEVGRLSEEVRRLKDTLPTKE